MFHRQFLTVAALLSLLANAVPLWALGGTLDHPSLSIPTSEDGQRNATVDAAYKVLVEHKQQFVSGWFVNANSRLFFKGDAEKLNALLKDLAAIDGTELVIKYSRAAGSANSPFQKDKPDLPCQWDLVHDAWTDAPQRLTITIYLGDDVIHPEDVDLPTIRGKKPKEEKPVK